MSLIDRIFLHPVLQDAPPVLVDVGASGGVHPEWRSFARYSIGVGFEPDSREIGALASAKRQFRKWIYCNKLAVADPSPDGQSEFYLTESPFCSSTLKPDTEALQDWAFSSLFNIREMKRVGATTLPGLLEENGLSRVDWLKCDTQGTDLRLFLSLRKEMRQHVLAVEFEPGLIDAYCGEDKFHQVLAAMDDEPFWLARLEVHGTPRGRLGEVTLSVGKRAARIFGKYGPIAPGWVNALYLNKGVEVESLTMRDFLLLWVFVTAQGHPAAALALAVEGTRRFGGDLFDEMARRSAGDLRTAAWETWPRWPGLLWKKLERGFNNCRNSS